MSAPDERDQGTRSTYPSWWYDRLSQAQRKVLGSAAWLVFLGMWGLFVGTVLRLPGDTWADAFEFPVGMALAVVGLRWAPAHGTPASKTLRARRVRAWIGLPTLLALPPLLWGSIEVFGGFATAFYAVILGVLIDRWALWDFKLTDLFGDSQEQPEPSVHRQREGV
jgi:hypothetical protein